MAREFCRNAEAHRDIGDGVIFWSAVASEARHRFGFSLKTINQSAVAASLCRRIPDGCYDVMKIRILFSLLVLISAAAPMMAQTDAGLNQVTLYWFSPSDLIDSQKMDPSRSSVNFETGMRGSARTGAYDLRYGGMVIGTPHKQGEPGKILADWLGVIDCRNMIVDLGAKQWRDFKETPPFPQPKTTVLPRPLDRPICAVDTSAGRTDFSPYRQFVMGDPGHMYLMRILRERRVIYVMFRVESMVTRDNCVLSWKLVKPPNITEDEK